MGKAGNGLLAVWMEPPPEHEDDFNRWYDDEHLPERMAIPGFLSARRYESLAGEPKYIALYYLEDLGVLGGDAYQKVRANATPWTRKVMDYVKHNIRREYELLLSVGESPPEPAPFVYIVGLETAPEHEDELNRWYNQEHLAALGGVPGVFSARRYKSKEGTPRYLAVYEWDAPEIREGKAWQKAAETPWTVRMRTLFAHRQSNVGRLIKSM
jgi:hypothetical protein